MKVYKAGEVWLHPPALPPCDSGNVTDPQALMFQGTHGIVASTPQEVRHCLRPGLLRPLSALREGMHQLRR